MVDNAPNLVAGLLGVAALLPLAASLTVAAFRPLLAGSRGRTAAAISSAAIVASAVLSWSAGGVYLFGVGPGSNGVRPAVVGSYAVLAEVADVRIGADYLIDGLTLLMFCLVTAIAALVHLYALEYLAEEASDAPVVDEELLDPRTHDDPRHHQPLQRPGRMAAFYQYLSLFCFSMLGLVLSGSLLLTFVFWELVGLTSYLLIGFYRERPAAMFGSAQAFLVNRVGDVGFLAGLGLFFAALGTWTLGDHDGRPGLLSQIRPAGDSEGLTVPPGFARIGGANLKAEGIPNPKAEGELKPAVRQEPAAAQPPNQKPAAAEPPREKSTPGYGWLVLAGFGLVCGCLGKSAQFPLHVWLADAMAGPTPVSALVHSATMVAAGVYFVGRVHPLLPAEALVAVAYLGLCTLLLGAAFALVAVDLKRVLAFSTISQLGYMLLGLGVGAWEGGLSHLFTHACFKSLLFLGAGAVIHAAHEQNLARLGGLRKALPWTAGAMLVATLAAAGAGIPYIDLGLAGYYSKDAILAQALVFLRENPAHAALYWGPLAGSALTSFYMFRLWLLTFTGPSRAVRHPHAPGDQAHDPHAPHDPAWAMRAPLVVLAVASAIVAWTVPFLGWGLRPALAAARWQPSVLQTASPVGAHTAESHAADPHAHAAPLLARWEAAGQLKIPNESLSHAGEVHATASLAALAASLTGALLAIAFYGVGALRAGEVREEFSPLHRLLRAEGGFAPLYDRLFVRPSLQLGAAALWIDGRLIDPLLHGAAALAVAAAKWDDRFDRRVVDGAVDGLAGGLYRIGIALQGVQSGRLRQYLLYLAAGLAVALLAAGYALDWTRISR